MRITFRIIAGWLLVLAVPFSAFAQSEHITRRDGFLLLWNSIQRPAETVRETPYTDVPEGSIGFKELRYAKARGLLLDATEFYPDWTLLYSDALIMLFRTRNVEPFNANGGRRQMETVESEDMPLLASHYGLPEGEGPLSREKLLSLMQTLDTALASEEHETSFYSEKFHGDGTAFGETFDMNAFTAAHRTFPHNTLVRVTNVGNGKSVTVRINDRGPFVQGRDMDLSLAAFLSIEERSKGKIQARYERLGDASLVSSCGSTRTVRRVYRRVILDPGIPDIFELGKTLSLRAKEPFVIHDIQHPDGTSTGMQTWVTKDEVFQITPEAEGLYRFQMGTKEGKTKEIAMEVKQCGEGI